MQKEFSELIEAVNSPELDSRVVYQAIDILQDAIDYLDSIADNLYPMNFSVIVKINGFGIKFQDPNYLAEFLAERINA